MKGHIPKTAAILALLIVFSSGCGVTVPEATPAAAPETPQATGTLPDIRQDGTDDETPEVPDTDTGDPRSGEETDIMSEATLLGKFESREEAEKAAGLYGISLANFNERSGIASFLNTSGLTDPEVIRLGKENGWPGLEKVHIYSAYAE